MRELDALLLHYLNDRYPKVDTEERKAFEAVLDLADPVLWSHVLGQTSPSEPDMRHVIDEIARFRN